MKFKSFLVSLLLSSAALADTPGQILNKVCPTSQWMNKIVPGQQPQCQQPYYSDIAGAPPGTVWGSIIGTLSDQTDLQNALDAKQPAGNYISALTSDVSATGPGSSSATVNAVGGSSAASVHNAAIAVSQATDAATPSTLVKRDGSGNFAASIITAALSGNADTATQFLSTPNSCSSNQYSSAIAANGDLTCSAVTDAQLSLSDITTNNTTSSAHGFAPKLTGDPNEFLNGIGVYAVPAGSGGSGITELLGDVTANGVGAVEATVDFVGGSTAADVNSATILANAATASNVNSAIVKRDSGGNIGVSHVVGILVGNADTATALAATPTGCSSGQFANAIDALGNLTCAAAGSSLTVGTFDSGTASADGAHIDTGALIMQSATALVPGLVNIGTQSFAGDKTFTGALTASNLTGTNSGDVTLGTANGLSLSAQALSLGAAATSTTGALTSTDWNTFNGKQSALSFGNLSDTGTDGITVTGGSSAVIGSGTSIAQHVSDTTHAGYLSASDWNSFNGKQSALTLGDLSDVGTDGITVTNGVGSVVGTGTSIAQQASDSSHAGYLSSTDWSTFNGKQASGNYLTALTGDGAASGPGSGVFTLATVNSNVGSFTNGSFTVNAKGLITAASSGATPEVPLTFSTGLTRTVNTITVNASQNISTLSNLTGNGFVKTSGGTGALSIDSSTYLTGNQTVTLSGDVSGAGATAITTAIGTNKVSNSMLAQAPTLTLKGNNTGGTANEADLTVSQVNSMLGSLSNPMTTLGDIIYEDATPSPARLAGNTTSTKKFLRQTGTGSLSAAPAWDDPAFSDVTGQATLAQLPSIAGNTILGNNTGSTGVPIALTATQTLAVVSPLTTKGDLPTFSTINTRLPVGTDGQLFRANSTQTTGLFWGWGNGFVNVANTTYAILNTDDLLNFDASGGTFTATLPTATTNSGKVIRLQKADATFNVVTIATTSSQKIGAAGTATTYTIATQGEVLTVESDGSNWQIISHNIPSGWTTYTWVPSSGTPGTVTQNLMKWRRLGDSIEVQHNFIQTVGGSSGAVLAFNLPSGLAANTSNWSTYTGGSGVFGQGGTAAASTLTYSCWSTYASTTSFNVICLNGATTVVVGATPLNLGGTPAWSVSYKVPITNWNP